MKAQLKIVSDGTPVGTRVLVDGKVLQGVTRANFIIGVDGLGRCNLSLDYVALELEGDVDIEACFENPSLSDDAPPYIDMDPAGVIRKATS